MPGTNSLQQPELLAPIEHLLERPTIDRPLMPTFINRSVDILLIQRFRELIQGEMRRMWVRLCGRSQMCWRSERGLWRYRYYQFLDCERMYCVIV